MSRPTFNVLHEPWIPLVRSNGEQEELGILGALSHAHEFAAIRDLSPIVEFGLYRLLVAFLLDALVLAGRRPESKEDLQDLLIEQQWNKELLDDYVARCGDVFDLFHPERPFLQCAATGGEERPLAALYPGVPSGTNVILWHHEGEEEMGATPAEAARLLATIAPFMTAGGAGLSPSINGAPGIYALPYGDSLFTTLTLNLPMVGPSETAPNAAWCNRSVPGGERTEVTTVEALTWRPRRVLLVPPGEAEGGQVRRMRFEAGDKTRFNWIDPNLAYIYQSDKTTPVRMRTGRPFWRDAGPLALLDRSRYGRDDGKVQFCRPQVVDTAFATSERLRGIRLYGMRTDLKMKVFEWASGILVVPCSLGRSTALGAWVQSELDLADHGGNLVIREVNRLHPSVQRGDRSAAPLRMATDAERSYWQTLEPEFYLLMDRAAAMGESGLDDPEKAAGAAQPWRDAIQRGALAAFEEAAKDLDADSDALERTVNARRRLSAELRKVLSHDGKP